MLQYTRFGHDLNHIIINLFLYLFWNYKTEILYATI